MLLPLVTFNIKHRLHPLRFFLFITGRCQHHSGTVSEPTTALVVADKSHYATITLGRLQPPFATSGANASSTGRPSNRIERTIAAPKTVTASTYLCRSTYQPKINQLTQIHSFCQSLLNQSDDITKKSPCNTSLRITTPNNYTSYQRQ